MCWEELADKLRTGARASGLKNVAVQAARLRSKQTAECREEPEGESQGREGRMGLLEQYEEKTSLGHSTSLTCLTSPFITWRCHQQNLGSLVVIQPEEESHTTGVNWMSSQAGEQRELCKALLAPESTNKTGCLIQGFLSSITEFMNVVQCEGRDETQSFLTLTEKDSDVKE